MIIRKRKLSNDKIQQSQSEEELLTDQLKRFRLMSTPGEIRLQKDIKDLEVLHLREFKISIQDSVSVIVSFNLIHKEFDNYENNTSTNLYENSNIVQKSVSYNNNKSPTTFLIRITKYYPHCVPDVKCLDNYTTCCHIDKFGKVKHEILENWTAIMSLSNIIQALKNIRETFQICCHNNLNNNIDMTTIPDNNSSDEIDIMIDDDNDYL